MKEKTFIVGLLAFLILGTVLDTGSTDAIFVAITVAFFGLCFAYTDWCGRL